MGIQRIYVNGNLVNQPDLSVGHILFHFTVQQIVSASFSLLDQASVKDLYQILYLCDQLILHSKYNLQGGLIEYV